MARDVSTLPVAWLVLTRWLFPVGSEPMKGRAAMLRDERGGDRAVDPAVTDAGIHDWRVAPVRHPIAWRPLRVALTWTHAERLPSSVLILLAEDCRSPRPSSRRAWPDGSVPRSARWPNGRCSR